MKVSYSWCCWLLLLLGNSFFASCAQFDEEVDAEIVQIFAQNEIPNTSDSLADKLRFELDDQAMERIVRYGAIPENVIDYKINRPAEDYWEVHVTLQLEVQDSLHHDSSRVITVSRSAVVYWPRSAEVFDLAMERVFQIFFVGGGLPFLVVCGLKGHFEMILNAGLIILIGYLMSIYVRHIYYEPMASDQ